MAKLFLFDLGTLDGIFRVAVFIVVGLILLGMGAGYARLLEKQDKQQGCDARLTGVIWIIPDYEALTRAWVHDIARDEQTSRIPGISGTQRRTCSGCWST